MSSVRFSDPSNPKGSNSPSTAFASTQTQGVQCNSIGTDPPKAPERWVQTEQQLLWNPAAAKTLRIEPRVVEAILRELERAEREEKLFGAYERRKWGIGGLGRGLGGRKALSLRPIKNVDLPKIDAPSASTALLAIRSGPGSRVAILIGEPQHDSAWCAEHIGQQLILVHRRQVTSIPLAACPSEAVFGRHGELLVLGLHSGEMQLISFSAGSIGELLWSSSGAGALHGRAVTKMEWAVGGGGTGDSVLISAGLDGRVVKSRLEPNNRLEPQGNAQIGMVDLPNRKHRKGAAGDDRPVGLVDFVQIGRQQIFVGTETGALLELDPLDLAVKNAVELEEKGGIEQIGAFEGRNGGQGHFVWRNSDGRVWQRPIEGEADLGRGEGKILPIGAAKNGGEFCLLKSATPFLILLCESPGGEGRQLVGWDLENGELSLRDEEFGAQFEGIWPDQNAPGGNSLLAISGGLFARRNEPNGAQLNYFEVDIEEE